MDPIHELLQNRYSPRAFSDRSVPRETIRTLLEAARWAPSSYNEQPWRFFVASKDDPELHARLLSCLAPGNQDWAKNAPVLMLSVASMTFTRNGKQNRHAFHDVGLAVSQLILQASVHGLQAHQMAGFDAAKARELYRIPDGFEPVAAIAIGFSAEASGSSRSRRAQDEIAFAGTWGEAY